MDSPDLSHLSEAASRDAHRVVETRAAMLEAEAEFDAAEDDLSDDDAIAAAAALVRARGMYESACSNLEVQLYPPEPEPEPEPEVLVDEDRPPDLSPVVAPEPVAPEAIGLTERDEQE